MFDLHLLLSPDFWFSFGWNPLQPGTAKLMAAAFAVLAAVGVLLPRLVAGRAPKFERKAWQGVGRPAIAAGLLGALFTFCAYEQVPLLAARFWFLALGVGFLIAEAIAVRDLLLEIPQHRDDIAARDAAAKYLPKKKS